jgi:hypothetical protein
MPMIMKGMFVSQWQFEEPAMTNKGMKWLVSEIEKHDAAFGSGKMTEADKVKSNMLAALAGADRDFWTDYSKALGYLMSRLGSGVSDPMQLMGTFGRFKKPPPPDLKTGVLMAGGQLVNVSTEDFGSRLEPMQIITHLKLISELVRDLAVKPNASPWKEWFPKTAYPEVASSIKNLDSYLNVKCQRITYRKLVAGKKCDNGEVQGNLAGQVIPNIVMPGFDRADFRKEGGNVHVQSGLRVFFGPLYWTVKDKYDKMLKTVEIYRFMTHFHELTHKILKTTDQVYELDNCKKIKNTEKAVMCADSWAYFLVDYAKEKGKLPGETVVNPTMKQKFSALKAKFGG